MNWVAWNTCHVIAGGRKVKVSQDQETSSQKVSNQMVKLQQNLLDQVT